MPSFAAMNIRRILKAGAALQLARYALNLRRQSVLQRQRRRNVAIGAIAVAAAGAALFWLRSRGEETPAWVRKKQRKEARREAARREREQGPARPGRVHLEANADTALHVPIGEQKH